MTKRPLAISAWRRPLGPAAVTAFQTALLAGPISLFFVFGALPPFWGGASNGAIAETLYAAGIATNVAWNAVFDALNSVLPILPKSLKTPDWVPELSALGVWSEFKLRLLTATSAFLWVSGILAIRSYQRIGRVQGFEYVSGPRLWEGPPAASRINAAMASEDKVEKDAVYIARDIPLSRTREVLSFAIFGAQGSGKSTVLKFLMGQLVRQPRTKLVVLDQKGDLTATWPNAKVVFFAPHDRRSHAWDIGADILGEVAAQEFAAALVPAEGPESVWPQGARLIVEAVIIAVQRIHGRDWGFSELVAKFQTSPVELRLLVEPVRPETLNFLGIDESGQFTRTSVGYVTNLQVAILPLLRPLAISWGNIPRERRISIKSWIHDWRSPLQTLILQNNTDFSTISSAWLRQVIQQIVRRSGSSAYANNKNRIWILLDEFPQLGYIPDLLKIPETHRAKGVTLLLTAQSISQIYEKYSEAEADTLVTLMQTKIILKPGQGSDLVERMNMWLGKLKWRDPADTGVTDTGATTSIPEHDDDLIAPAYMTELGKTMKGIDGLVIGIGPDAYRVDWPFQEWPEQRQAVELAEWAQM